MRLIDVDELRNTNQGWFYTREACPELAILAASIDDAPTVPAIPISVIEQIKAEIRTKYDSIPWRNNDYDDGWIEALEWVLDDVIDKHIKEYEV